MTTRTLTEREILTALGRLSSIIWSACGRRDQPMTSGDWEIVRDAVERMDRILSVVSVARPGVLPHAGDGPLDRVP